MFPYYEIEASSIIKYVLEKKPPNKHQNKPKPNKTNSKTFWLKFES